MIHTEQINYTDGHLTFHGFISYDKTHLSPKPCVLVAHDWTGRSETFCKKATELAKKGYVGFAIDMYGEGAVGDTTAEKKALLSPIMEHRPQVTSRMLAAYHTVAALSVVDSARIGAIGYCFGGLCVLDLARSGSDVKGVVSLHGLLTAPEQSVCKKIRAKILALHGYDDPMVPPAQVQQFAQEMTLKKADWQVHMYGHTKHAFTNPKANDAELGLHYNKLADKRSWASTELFLNELFKR